MTTKADHADRSPIGAAGRGAGPSQRRARPSRARHTSGDRPPGAAPLTADAPAAAAAHATASWDFAPAPESFRPAIAPRCDLFIGGRSVAARDGRRFATINPATEETLSEVAEGGAADVDAAVAAARRALPRWARLKPVERAKYLFRIARRIQERARELAVLETVDGGKPIKESRDVDVPLAAQHFFYHAGWCDKLRFVAPGRGGGDPEPVGVCGQVIPWNFPLLMAAWKLAPALACGNTCVLKPAETTPLTALRLAEILEEIELPPGVVNIVTGGPETGRALVEHPDVDKIAFTGSTEVGRRIAAACARDGRRLTLELGGKGANIVFADAALDQAVEGIVAGIWFNQGHVCCAGSRLLVEESIAADVIGRLEHRMRSLRVGDPMDKNTDVGAINSKAQLATIHRYLDAGEREGAVRHDPCPSAVPERGFFVRPCFFTGVQPSHTIAREEIFGPVLAVMTFRTPEEAIARANASPYGLSAGVWTDKGAKAFELARHLEAGVIWCNSFNRFDPAAPFGGYKESGFGREGGVAGLRSYLRA
ncbi:MAG TPA: aldehyde dehydrogenase family protein [Phycisphaerales bacterium]|nr:aldehyde dehydrogenase family protein [Phycisphaerales bacterium]HMP37219.1 aldehyde dehydrogenase family protein [Phycisphaerales bacterium]